MCMCAIQSFYSGKITVRRIHHEPKITVTIMPMNIHKLLNAIFKLHLKL